jgi:hypothetical protein
MATKKTKSCKKQGDRCLTFREEKLPKEHLNPAKVKEYAEYLHSPKAQVEMFLDKLDSERQWRRE